MHPVEALFVPLGRALRDRHPAPGTGLATAPELATPNRIELRSPAFADGGVIPDRNCGWLIGDDLSPALEWSALPEGTADLVLLVEDLDAPGATPRVHGVAAFAPDTDGLPEGALVAKAPGVRYLAGRLGPTRYRGPRPLPGHGTHRYRFHLLALDARADLGAIATPAEVPAALAGHVLASGTLTGTRTA